MVVDAAVVLVQADIACPSQVSENDQLASADFWHEARLQLRARLGSNLFILPQCAPAGDQSPHLLIHKQLEAEMYRRKGLTQRQEIGRRIAAAVEEVFSFSRRPDFINSQAMVAHHRINIDLPKRLVTEAEKNAACEEIARLEADTSVKEAIKTSQRHVQLWRNNNLLKRFQQQHTLTMPMELHVLRIGEVAMATSTFELFLDYGLRIKARSRAPQTMLVQLACRYDGYLPTERAVKGASYGAEVISNQAGPEAGQILVERTLESIKQLWS